ncbi:MAG: hypothetical protein V3T40_05090 [Nitrososphaerales archaeon]
MKKLNLIFGNVRNVVWKHGERRKQKNNYLFILYRLPIISMSAKAVVITIDMAAEQNTITIIIQPSKREPTKISVWLEDYKFGTVNLEEAIKFVIEQVTTTLKNAGYEFKKGCQKSVRQIPSKNQSVT